MSRKSTQRHSVYLAVVIMALFMVPIVILMPILSLEGTVGNSSSFSNCSSLGILEPRGWLVVYGAVSLTLLIWMMIAFILNYCQAFECPTFLCSKWHAISIYFSPYFIFHGVWTFLGTILITANSWSKTTIWTEECIENFWSLTLASVIMEWIGLSVVVIVILVLRIRFKVGQRL